MDTKSFIHVFSPSSKNSSLLVTFSSLLCSFLFRCCLSSMLTFRCTRSCFRLLLLAWIMQFFSIFIWRGKANLSNYLVSYLVTDSFDRAWYIFWSINFLVASYHWITANTSMHGVLWLPLIIAYQLILVLSKTVDVSLLKGWIFLFWYNCLLLCRWKTTLLLLRTSVSLVYCSIILV